MIAGGNFQLKTNAYKCAHMEKTHTHTHMGENCDFACLFIGLRHLPPPPPPSPSFLSPLSLLHFHAGLRLAVDVNADAAGCECGKKKKNAHTRMIRIYTWGENNISFRIKRLENV